jgi:hypothetical protein
MSKGAASPLSQPQATMNPDTTIQLPWLLLAAASTDQTRYCLLGAYIDPIDRAVVATDGRRAVIHPIPGDAPVKRGYITTDMVKMAKIKNKAGLFLDYEAGLLNGIPTDYDEDTVGNYPNWKQVDPTFAPTYRAHLNPHLLAGIISALGVAKDDGICLEFSDDGFAPFRILYKDARAILMPMRGTEDSGLLIEVGGGKNTDALKKELTAAKAKITELSERSGNSKDAEADVKVIDALRAELFQQRARVKELEAILASPHTTTGNAIPPGPQVKLLDPAPAGKATPKGPKEKPLVPAATARPALTRNQERDGIELRFNGKPDDVTRATLKERGFRWLPGQPGQPWAVKYSEEAWIFAHSLADGTAYTPMPETEAPEPTPESALSRHSEAPPANVTPMPTPSAESRVRKITLPDF